MRSESNFATTLKRHRLAAGLSQEALAERARLSAHAISTLERGVRRLPYRDTVARLAAALELSDFERAAFERFSQQRRGPRGRLELVSPAAPSRGFPALTAPLVGRDADLAALAALLRDESVRLVTLTGAGGVGKTSLALALGQALQSLFSDGVVFVGFAAIEDARRVPSAIASALGVRDDGARTEESLALALRESDMLLVLDNCEQIADAAPTFAALLAACPRLRVLATSREPLRLRAEHEYVVGPLPQPTDDEARRGDLATLANVPSVALFLERARRVRFGFALTSDDATTIARICRRLDGLPLALELAAARMRVETPSSLASQLEHRLDVLVATTRDLPARQRTMRDVIAWSVDRLEHSERSVFARLAVFPADFEVRAATAICRGEADDARTVEDVLAVLLEKSLLVREDSAPGPRFRLLETIREFAHETLVAGGEASERRRMHARYFSAVYRRDQIDRWRFGASQFADAARVAADAENYRTALRYALDERDAELAVALAAALGPYFARTATLAEGSALLDAALALPVDDVETVRMRANVLFSAGRLALYRGDYVVARAHIEEALASFRAREDARGIADATCGPGLILLSAGDDVAAERALRECLTCRTPQEDAEVLTALLFLGFVAQRRRHYADARTFLEKSAMTLRAIDDPWTEALLLWSLGLVAYRQRRDDEADEHLRRSLALSRKINDRIGIARSMSALGELASAAGRFAEADACFFESLVGQRAVGARVEVTETLLAISRHALRQSDVRRAVRICAAAVALRASLEAPLSGEERGDIDEFIVAARARLDTSTFDASWSAGSALAADAAVAQALNVSEIAGVSR